MAVKGVSIGMMNKRITLLEPTVTINEGYGRDTSYAENAEVWAYVKKKSGNSSLEANISGHEVTHEFYIRETTNTVDLNNNWLIRYRGNSYSISDFETVSEVRGIIKISATEREDDES